MRNPIEDRLGIKNRLKGVMKINADGASLFTETYHSAQIYTPALHALSAGMGMPVALDESVPTAGERQEHLNRLIDAYVDGLERSSPDYYKQLNVFVNGRVAPAAASTRTAQMVPSRVSAAPPTGAAVAIAAAPAPSVVAGGAAAAAPTGVAAALDAALGADAFPPPAAPPPPPFPAAVAAPAAPALGADVPPPAAADAPPLPDAVVAPGAAAAPGADAPLPPPPAAADAPPLPAAAVAPGAAAARSTTRIPSAAALKAEIGALQKRVDVKYRELFVKPANAIGVRPRAVLLAQQDDRYAAIEEKARGLHEAAGGADVGSTDTTKLTEARNLWIVVEREIEPHFKAMETLISEKISRAMKEREAEITAKTTRKKWVTEKTQSMQAAFGWATRKYLEDKNAISYQDEGLQLNIWTVVAHNLFYGWRILFNKDAKKAFKNDWAEADSFLKKAWIVAKIWLTRVVGAVFYLPFVYLRYASFGLGKLNLKGKTPLQALGRILGVVIGLGIPFALLAVPGVNVLVGGGLLLVVMILAAPLVASFFMWAGNRLADLFNIGKGLSSGEKQTIDDDRNILISGDMADVAYRAIQKIRDEIEYKFRTPPEEFVIQLNEIQTAIKAGDIIPFVRFMNEQNKGSGLPSIRANDFSKAERGQAGRTLSSTASASSAVSAPSDPSDPLYIQDYRDPAPASPPPSVGMRRAPASAAAGRVSSGVTSHDGTSPSSRSGSPAASFSAGSMVHSATEVEAAAEEAGRRLGVITAVPMATAATSTRGGGGGR